MTESGELMNAVKRFCFAGQELDTVNLKEEAGDLFWYMALLCQYLGCSFEEIQDTNIRKLAERYPDKFTADRSFNRDLVAERNVLTTPHSELRAAVGASIPGVDQTEMYGLLEEQSDKIHVVRLVVYYTQAGNECRSLLSLRSYSPITWFRVDKYFALGMPTDCEFVSLLPAKLLVTPPTGGLMISLDWLEHNLPDPIHLVHMDEDCPSQEELIAIINREDKI